ncbi:8-oxo-dGTP pyrophosphatase MutT (NUDIX family) [Mesorhizobium sp. J18]|uniref:NUDIX hydrolase n=1 Tax=Mesorhizobium sp. J18 TaxID=935263 RepID=UPI00119A5F23|nr:NUDIX hydrolase [Mesorhizobium sp. J18]TWG94163.1 8-oxo-dGTP pyrophosphatase MutT (NUDIX family) [Mesorhizobium sp. J18]
MLISHGTRNTITEHIRRLFGGNPTRIQAAALPWRKTGRGVEVMLVTSCGTGRWVLPKGWPEGKEPLHNAAAREAGEEAGVKGVIGESEVGRYFYDKEQPSGLPWRCEVHVFPLEVEREAKKWPEMKKRVRKWFRAEQAASLVDEPDLGEIIMRFGNNPRKIAA